MNIDEIIQLTLDLVNMKELPDDSAIYVHPKENQEIKKILYGIDIGTAELYYAKENGYDCVIAHHPLGLVNHWQVFRRHLDQLVSKGVPKDEANQIIEKKLLRFKFSTHARNYDLVTSFARLIEMPFLNIHCPSDELGRRLITASIEQLLEPTLAEVKAHLESSFIEFQNAQTKIEIAKGKEENPLGNWIFSHGAFTNGGSEIAHSYYRHGVDTVIYIHIASAELEKILNFDTGQLLITGHLASDSIGINPFLKALEENGVEIASIGGLIR